MRLVALALLAAVALAGYFAGYHRARSTPAAAIGAGSRIASGADVLLEYPSSWQRTSSAPAIPGLALTSELTLAPGGSEHGGLVSGQLAAGEPSPLPAAFLRGLRPAPTTELLAFPGGQAYKYSGLKPRGYPWTLDLYVIPSPGNGPTAVGCYAASGSSALLAECEQIVAKITLVGQSQFDLTPDAGYAQHLGALVRSLDAERLALRQSMRASHTPRQVGVFADRLAARLSVAASALRPLEPPIAAGAAQAALASAILADKAAYAALGAAAREEQLESYDSQLTRVEHTDAEVSAALENFALLGYGRA